MLRSLYIKNIAIISSLSIEFHEGMTSITGETGAGKSIVIDALSLALGARADQNLLKHDSEKAEIIIEFDISDHLPAKNWLHDQELELDEPLCILKRHLYSHRPSKSFINDRPVSATALSELGQMLVNICGQQEHLNLVNPSTRLSIIDQHAKTDKLLKSLKTIYKQLKDIEQALKDLNNARNEGEDHNDLLAFLVDELRQGNFSAADYQTLDNDHKRLSHNSDIINSVNTSIDLLHGAAQNNIVDLLNQVSKLLDSASHYEPRLKNTIATLDSANIACEEAMNELTALSQHLDLDPAELHELEQRLSSYHTMARKHRCEPAQLEEKLHSLEAKLELIENSQAQLDKLTVQQLELTNNYKNIAQQISKLRRKSSKSLSKSITAQLQQLNLKGAACVIECKTDTSVINVSGQDTVQFLVTTNAGQPPGPIEKIASGGELSRISMAIVLESSTRAGDAVLIFDEVDTGISGKTADIVGDKLKQLATLNQTLCITHLPQVACKAQHQLRVSKSNDKHAQVKLEYLDTEERVIELARFLSGKKITQESMANARVMLEDTAITP